MYLEAMRKEMEFTLQHFPTTSLHSIFVGGGTPTALNEQQLTTLTENIKQVLPYDKLTEYTFEVNPGDLSEEKFYILKAAGVNRLSFGVQTFHNDLLEKIGRTHRAHDVYQSIDLAIKTGFTNISIDLIYGLPGQTLGDFSETVQTALSLPITHLSGYSLIVEPKTVFHNLMRKGKLTLPNDDDEADMYELLINEMENHGLKQYEISNFARKSFESRHNLTYWNNEHYYGFGAGAHSYIKNYRQANVAPLKQYIEKIRKNELPHLDVQVTTKQEQMEEEMFLGLRKTTGVSIRRFYEKFAENPLELFVEQIQSHQREGLLEINNNEYITLTKKGRFLGNEVFQSFIGIN